jgi:hypothetical protein
VFTFGDHVAELRDRFPRVPPPEAEAFVWQAVKDVFNDFPWSFAIKEGKLVTEDLYNTGTVELTNGSTAVTLTSGTWDTTWASRRFAGEGRSENYGITISTSTTGTLDYAWQGEDDPAATYAIYRDVYALPTDCDYGKAYFVIDPNDNRVIHQKDFGVFTRRKINENAISTTGTPEILTYVGLTAAGVPQVQFGPQAPSDARVYTLLYFQKPTRPTLLTSIIAPAFPESYEDIIWRRAVWQAAVHPRYRQADWQRYFTEYHDRLFEAQSKLNGSNEISRRIPGTNPATNDPDSFWAPRVEYVG